MKTLGRFAPSEQSKSPVRVCPLRIARGRSAHVILRTDDPVMLWELLLLVDQGQPMACARTPEPPFRSPPPIIATWLLLSIVYAIAFPA